MYLIQYRFIIFRKSLFFQIFSEFEWKLLWRKKYVNKRGILKIIQSSLETSLVIGTIRKRRVIFDRLLKYKILSKGSFVQCTSAARGSAVVAGSSKLWLRAMTLKVNSVKIDVNCQHQMLQQSAFQYFPSNSFKIRIH